MSVHLPKGTRDFLPEQMTHRLQVMDTLRGVFSRFGFEPLETPAFERIETLMGKYGDEGEQLIYKILKRGEGGLRGETDLALRYDLTVPLARVVAMHPDLRLPFKRYQMQPVWRADRPQKGRFREFWQCDVDIVGTTSTLADAECLAVVGASLTALAFSEFTIRLNDRRILRAITAAIGHEAQETDVLVAIDKLDKVGQDGVSAELSRKGLSDPAIDTLWDILQRADDNATTLSHLAERLDERGQAGTNALTEVLSLATDMGVDPARVLVDPTLARGLGYYTGPVFETEVVEPKVGSISGGGRYDGLVGIFSKRQVPAVGVSLGLERIIAVMQERAAAAAQRPTARVLVSLFSAATRPAALRFATRLREAGVPTEVYLDDAKMKKQFKHANARGYPFIAIIGPDEAADGRVTIKDMTTGTQSTTTQDQAILDLAGSKA